MNVRLEMVSSARPKTLAEQTADAIVRAAAEGRLKAGERLMEAELARDLHISRVPVREALRLLESQGVVVNEPYRGIYLFESDDASLAQLLSVRMVLEEHAIAVAMPAIAADPARLHPFEDALSQMKDAVRRRDIYAVAMADMQFHRAIYLATGNQTLVDIWGLLARKLMIVVGLRMYESFHDDVYDSHAALLELVRVGDLAGFVKALRPHNDEALRAQNRHGA